MRNTGVDHLDLVVSSLELSLPLYRELLAPLGYTSTSEIVGERGERVVYLGGSGIVPVSLRQAQTEGAYDATGSAFTTSRSKRPRGRWSTSGIKLEILHVP
jgi:hypothetical protein